MELFEEQFKPIYTDPELEALLVEHSSYDPAYVCQSAVVHRRKTKDWMAELWKQYEPYADSNFLREFKTRFTQRSWELYLGATLLNRRAKLGVHRSTGPDFELLNLVGERLGWVEAIAPTKGDGNDRVPDMVNGAVMDVPEEQMLLRIAGALEAKVAQYAGHVSSNVIGPDEPYVIAINRAELDHVDTILPLVLKVCFPIGDLTLRVMVNGVRQEDPKSHWSRRESIKKVNGEEIPMRFFEDPAHAGISAVIYSKDHIINSPRLPSEMGENFVVVHNPLAKNPLPKGSLSFGSEFIADEESVHKTREAVDWERPDPFEHLNEE